MSLVIFGFCFGAALATAAWGVIAMKFFANTDNESDDEYMALLEENERYKKIIKSMGGAHDDTGPRKFDSAEYLRIQEEAAADDEDDDEDDEDLINEIRQYCEVEIEEVEE